jgi:hypothetical protein
MKEDLNGTRLAKLLSLTVQRKSHLNSKKIKQNETKGMLNEMRL